MQIILGKSIWSSLTLKECLAGFQHKERLLIRFSQVTRLNMNNFVFLMSQIKPFDFCMQYHYKREIVEHLT